MAKVCLKNALSDRSDQENEKDCSHGPKKEQRVIQQDSTPKRGKPHKKQKASKWCRTSSSSQSRCPPKQGKNRRKKQS